MTEQLGLLKSGIRDNRDRGTVAEFLKTNIESGSTLAIVSAYFTIYAFAKLEDELNKINHLHFLFGEPSFVTNVNTLTETQSFKIENDEIKLQNKLQQNAPQRARNACPPVNVNNGLKIR